MTQRSAAHATFVIERTFDAPPARVFKAFADPKAKALWFGGTPGEWEQQVREMDFRVGGREQLAGKWANGTVSAFDCRYQDIVPNVRIIFVYDMHIDGRKISVSMTTVELKAAGAGTRMTFTEQDVFLDGYDDAGSRERGTKDLIDRLGASLFH